MHSIVTKNIGSETCWRWVQILALLAVGPGQFTHLFWICFPICKMGLLIPIHWKNVYKVHWIGLGHYRCGKGFFFFSLAIILSHISKGSDMRLSWAPMTAKAFLFPRPCHLQILGKVFMRGIAQVSIFNCLPLNFGEHLLAHHSLKLLLSLLYSFNILKMPVSCSRTCLEAGKACPWKCWQ